MDRPHRESRPHNGITLRRPSQLTFATKSAHFRHAVVAGQCLLLGVDRTCRSTLVTSGFHPLRKSATGSGSGSGRLVVEIVGGVTEVSLHVRYGGISGPRSGPYQTDVRADRMQSPEQGYAIEAVKIPLSGSVAGFAGEIGAVLTRQDILTNLQCGPSRRGRTGPTREDR